MLSLITNQVRLRITGLKFLADDGQSLSSWFDSHDEYDECYGDNCDGVGVVVHTSRYILLPMMIMTITGPMRLSAPHLLPAYTAIVTCLYTLIFSPSHHRTPAFRLT